jgi:RuvB-like protein 2
MMSASIHLPSITDSAKLERIGAHSHIQGLGLNELLEPTEQLAESTSGPVHNVIGQYQARRALGVLIRLIQKQQAGTCRACLLAGPPGTGKTALARAVAHDLGANQESAKIPFVSMSAAQVYSPEMSVVEALTQAVRSAVGVCITEETDIIEGEVVEIVLDSYLENSAPNTSRRSAGRLTLCTTDMETYYDLGTKMIENIRAESISAGDVIRIDKSSGSGKITKLGRSYNRSRDYDAVSSTTKFVATPTGEISKRISQTHVVSLHEMDVINSRQSGFLALFAGDVGEITTEIRNQIDVKVQEWVEEGRATILPGVLFLDECHMLTMECYAYLNRALEQELLSPVIIFATNRGLAQVRNSSSGNANNEEYISPHGIPHDLLDRIMIVHTVPYTAPEIRQILQIRAREEEIELHDEALELLVRIAMETHSLRYAIHLISTSHCAAAKRRKAEAAAAATKKAAPGGNQLVLLCDVERCFTLFFDVQRSTRLLLDYQHEFLFNDVTALAGVSGMDEARHDITSPPEITAETVVDSKTIWSDGDQMLNLPIASETAAMEEG